MRVITETASKSSHISRKMLTRKLWYRNDKWIEWAVAEIWPFEIFQDGGRPSRTMVKIIAYSKAKEPRDTGRYVVISFNPREG